MGIEVTGGRDDASPASARGVLGVKVKSIGVGNAVDKVTNAIPGDVVIELFRLGQVLANERGVVRHVQVSLAHPGLSLLRHFAQTIAYAKTGLCRAPSSRRLPSSNDSYSDWEYFVSVVSKG